MNSRPLLPTTRSPLALISLSLGAFLLSAFAAAQSPERYALLVGINKYPNFKAEMQLNGCENDANYIKKELVTRYGFRESNIQTLLSRDATSAGIKRGLEWLETTSKPGDVCVFFYSGHGYQLPTETPSDKSGLDEILCPTDIKLTGATSAENYIRDKELNAWAKRMPNRRLTVILDCCHSGTGLRSLIRPCRGKYLYYEGAINAGSGVRALGSPQSDFFAPACPAAASAAAKAAGGGQESLWGFAPTRGMKAVGGGSGVQGVALIAACRKDELAAESEPVRIDGETRVHGCMTLKLIRGLKGEADLDRNKNVTFGELYDYLAVQPLVTERGVQHPQVEVDSALKDRGIFESRDIVVEPATPPVTPGSPNSPYSPVASSGAVVPLAVAVTLESDYNLPGPDFDEAQARALQQQFLSQLQSAGPLFNVVQPTSPYEASVVCAARREGSSIQYEVAVVDGSAQLRFRGKDASAQPLTRAAIQILRRMYTVRNLLRLAPPADSPYRLALGLKDGATRLMVGQKVQFVCRPNREGFITILNVDNRGETTLLYPNRWSGGRRTPSVRGGSEIVIPSSDSFEIEVTADGVGEEFAIGFLTPAPMDLREMGMDPDRETPASSSNEDGTAGNVTRGLMRSLVGAKARDNAGLATVGIPRSDTDSEDVRGMKAKAKDTSSGPGDSGATFSILNSRDWAVAKMTFTTLLNP